MYLKLMNGDDIIGHLEKEDTNTVIIRDPIQVTTFRVDGSGEMIFDLNPWTFCANTELVTIKKDHFFGPFKATAYLQEQYSGYIKMEKDRSGFLEQSKDLRRAAFEAFTHQQSLSGKFN